MVYEFETFCGVFVNHLAALVQKKIAKFRRNKFFLGHPNAHANLDSMRGGDQIKTFSSIKVLHGVCQQEQFYAGNKQFLALALKPLGDGGDR